MKSENVIKSLVYNASCYEDLTKNTEIIDRQNLRLIIPWNFNFSDLINDEDRKEIFNLIISSLNN